MKRETEAKSSYLSPLGAMLMTSDGQALSYGEIAQRLAGKRQVARMSAQAVGHNPVSLIVPCHRGVGKDGSLTGYGGGLWRLSKYHRVSELLQAVYEGSLFYSLAKSARAGLLLEQAGNSQIIPNTNGSEHKIDSKSRIQKGTETHGSSATCI